MDEKLFYAEPDLFVPRQTLSSDELNTVMALTQAEMEVRDSLVKGWFGVPTMGGLSTTLTVTATGDGLLIGGVRYTGASTITFAGAGAGTYTVQVMADGTLYKALTANASYLTVGTVVWSGAAFGTLTVTATVGMVQTGVGDVMGPGASIDDELVAFSGTGGTVLQGTGINKDTAAANLALAHAQLHTTTDHTDLAYNAAGSSGLTYAYKAGAIRVGATVIPIIAGTVLLTDDATNYVEVDSAGVVACNVVSYTDGAIPLATVVVASGGITGVTDTRCWLGLDDAVTNVVHRTGTESIDGAKTFTTVPIIPTADGLDSAEAASVGYVNAVASGLSWQDPVLAMNLTAPPGGETTGDRYIPASPATGLWTGHENDVAETPDNGTSWNFTTPLQGWTLINLDDSPLKQYTWNVDTSLWVYSGAAAVTYTASGGIKLVTNDFQVDLSDTDPSLEIADGGLRVKVDDTSIERSASGLQVKALGITNAMLGEAIVDTKLATISTAGKVSGAALTLLPNIPAGAGVIPVANLGTGAAGAGARSLKDNGTWVLDDLTSPSTSIADIAIIPYSTSNVAWTNMPAAVTELFGNVYGRFRYDASNATQYRILVYQAVAGLAGSDFNLQYSADGSVWAACDAGAAGELDVGTGTGFKVSAWTDLVAGALADNYFRIVGKDGNGTADPAFRGIRVQFLVPGGEGGFVEGTLVTTVGATGSDTNIPSEQAVREAITAVNQICLVTLTSTGTDTYAGTGSPAQSGSYATQQLAAFIPDVGNTGACSLNIDAVAAGTLKKNHDQDLVTGDIEAGQLVMVQWDGTYWQMQSQLASVVTQYTDALAVDAVEAAATTTTTPVGASDYLLAVVGGVLKRILYDDAAKTKRTIVLGAGGWPAATSGCSALTPGEGPTNKVNRQYWVFDPDTIEYLHFEAIMPDNYDGGTLTAKFVWAGATASGNVVWQIQALALGDGDAEDAAYGTAVTVTDAVITTATVHITSETSAITPAGTPAGGCVMLFRVSRKANDAADTCTGDAGLNAVRVEYGINKWSD